jgi:predicted thioesterase
MEINPNIKPGLKAELTETVSKKNTASAYGSGGLDIFATPAMIALMEKASLSAVAPLLAEGCSTVGTEVNIKHLASSPISAVIRAEGVLRAVDGRRLCFDVRAWNGDELIGEGTHERFIIDNKKFMEKTEAKLKK